MNFSPTAYKIIISILIAKFSFGMVGVSLSSDLIYEAGMYLIFALGMISNEKILSFLTVNKNFITQFFTILITTIVIIVIGQVMIPDFQIESSCLFCGSDSEFVNFSPIDLDNYGTIGLVSLTNGLIYALLDWLREF